VTTFTYNLTSLQKQEQKEQDNFVRRLLIICWSCQKIDLWSGRKSGGRTAKSSWGISTTISLRRGRVAQLNVKRSSDYDTKNYSNW